MSTTFHGRTIDQSIDDCYALSAEVDRALANITPDKDGNLHRSDVNRARTELLDWLRARVGDDAFMSWRCVLEASLETGNTSPHAIRMALFTQASLESVAPRLARKAFKETPPEG